MFDADTQEEYGHRCEAPARATRHVLWELVSEPATWPTWNAAVETLELDSSFTAGTTGRLTPPQGQPLPFRLTHVTPGRGYTSRTEIASTVTLVSTLSLVDTDTGVLVRQESRLTGPAAAHFAPSFAHVLAAGVESTVQRLAGHPG